MRRCTVTFAIVLIALSANALAREWIPLAEASPDAAEAVARIVSSDRTGTRIEIEIPGVMLEPGSPSSFGADVSVPGCGRIQDPGKPNLPVLTCLVAIPDEGGIELEVVSCGERAIEGPAVAPEPPLAVQGREPLEAVPDPTVYLSNAFYPAEVAGMSEPFVMRDLRLVQVRAYPVRFNPVTRTLVASERIEVRLNYVGGEGKNPKRVARPFRSEAFEPLYRALVLNYGELPPAQVRRGTYLVIAQDQYVEQLGDFVRWKQERGTETLLVPLSSIAPTPTNQDIKDYIQDAYDTWDSPPDYVLLVGDTWTTGPAVPCWYVTYGGPQEPTDHPYAELEGDDYFPDIVVGRMAIDSATDAVMATLKVLSYERDCDAGDDGWYERALMSAGNYGGTHVTSPRQTALRIGEMFKRCGYAQIDTVFYKPVTDPGPIMDSINNGVSFVNYRGWGNAGGWEYPRFSVDDVNSLSNGHMLPVMTSIVCGTGNFDSWGYDPCFAEAWIRAGTPGNLKGGPVVVAPSHFNTHTKWNNAVNVGIYEGILFEDLRHFGQAVIRGKIELYRNFPHDIDPGEGIEFYFNVYNTIGDPELYLRTAKPESFIVSHDSTVPFGKNVLEVFVTDADGEAVPGAEVTVWKEGESYDVRRLDGGRRVDVPLNAATEGEAHVTAFATNFVPYVGSVTVGQESQYVGWYGHSVDDDDSGESDGNGDGIVNPGETIELSVVLKNYGATDATDVQCDLEYPPADPVAYGDIAAGATAMGDAPFVLEIEEGLADGTELVYTLYAFDGSRVVWESEVRLVVGAPNLSYFTTFVYDGGDGVLDPGEAATVSVVLLNEGDAGATSVAGTLVGPPSGLVVTDDQGYWGEVWSGFLQWNNTNTFGVSVDPDVAIGHEFTMLLTLTGDDGLSQFVLFPLMVGTPSSSDPLGPDSYGYYCYDDTDVACAESPMYSWIEIDPGHGGAGTDLGLGYEDVTDVALPFTFRYYGEDFDQMAVCSNGDVGLGGAPVWEHQPRNSIIPCPLGPDAMIAAFWDNLFPDDADTAGGTGKILTDDLGDGRFVVEWSRLGTGYDNGGNTQTFELILYDPAQYPTSTGDGEIVVQYHTIANADTHNYATVGIENPAQSDGLLYTFYDIYATEAAPLVDNMAIKFTTDPPDGFPSSDVADGLVPCEVVLLGNRPNPFNPVTTISYVLPAKAEVELAVFDVAGRRVATLIDREIGAGRHEHTWDGRTDEGQVVASGVYFARLSALGTTRSTKMVLLK